MKLSHSDKWILTRLNKCVVQVNKNFEEYRFGDMTDAVYAFWRKELADFYLEAIKPVMNSDDEAAKEAALNTLYVCLDEALKMLHPAMPYLTEELYQRLPHAPGKAAESICISAFPQGGITFENENIEADIALVRQTVGGIRSQLAALGVPNNAKPWLAIQATTPELTNLFKENSNVVSSLTKACGVTVVAVG